jgi:hypothetical protein
MVTNKNKPKSLLFLFVLRVSVTNNVKVLLSSNNSAISAHSLHCGNIFHGSFKNLEQRLVKFGDQMVDGKIFFSL